MVIFGSKVGVGALTMFASPTEELLKQWERSESCFMFSSPAEIEAIIALGAARERKCRF